jgi:hypothetical protein
MLARYKLVSSADHAPNDALDSCSAHRRHYPTIALAVLTIANVCVLGFSIAIWRTVGVAATATPEASSTSLTASNSLDLPNDLARVESLPTAYVPFHWNTPWGAPNASEADPLWDNINTAHGHIAVDHEFAAENHVSYLEAGLQERRKHHLHRR